MDNVMPEAVECYSGSCYAERPIAFYWQGERLEISRIESAWLTPEGRRFRVRADDNQVFELLYLESDDCWQVRPVSG